MNLSLRIISLVACLLLSSVAVAQQTVLPGEGGRKEAIDYDYFPHRQYAFVWRNWAVVPKQKIAQILSTSVENVEALATSMGLSAEQRVEPEWTTTRGYITVLRRNWHLLPYEQLTQLLGMSREELKFRLIEDDFLFTKQGKIKPFCQPLRYVEPTAEMRSRAARIATDIAPFTEALNSQEPRFSFVREFETVRHGTAVKNRDEGNDGFELRMIFPYFAAFGDPLLDHELTTYPEELFRRLSDVGVNGVWVHSVLRMMVEPDDKGFPGDERAAERIEGLKLLVNRAAKYGIKIYLYVNEPRALEPEFFASSEQRKAYGGAIKGDLQTFCPSNPDVLAWLTRSMESLFTQVEDLGGVFTITASENLTTCVSHNNQHLCENCKDADYEKLIASVTAAIEKGVHSAAPDAKVIAWDWGWPDKSCEEIISLLPKQCWFMSVSEWGQPIERGGVKSTVGEYSISTVGPGPRALRNWEYARQAGLKTLAKVQVNSTWELSIVPAIPALDLVAQHAENLSQQSVDGVMLSWSLGGYPSENLKLFQSFSRGENANDVLKELALSEYGDKAAALVREAWRACSEGFREYPYHNGVVYFGPQHMGPSNPLLIKLSGFHSTMVGLPHDDLDKWRAVYPADVWIQQMERSATGFAKGVELLKQAREVVDAEHSDELENLYRRAEIVRIHLQSAAEQGRFVDARDNYYFARNSATRSECISAMRKACAAERKLIEEAMRVVTRDSSIGYESSNHYFYLPIDLVEAYISILHVESWLDEIS